MGYYQGDPFFGAAIPLLAKAAPFLARKFIPKVAVAAGRVFRKGAPIAAAGGVFEAGRAGAKKLFGGEERKKYRRMNVTNVKALRRAIRRSKGFAKLARSVITFTSPRAPKGKITFKTRKRR